MQVNPGLHLASESVVSIFRAALHCPKSWHPGAMAKAYRGYIGIMENKMETAIYGLRFRHYT